MRPKPRGPTSRSRRETPGLLSARQGPQGLEAGRGCRCDSNSSSRSGGRRRRCALLLLGGQEHGQIVGDRGGFQRPPRTQAARPPTAAEAHTAAARTVCTPEGTAVQAAFPGAPPCCRCSHHLLLACWLLQPLGEDLAQLRLGLPRRHGATRGEGDAGRIAARRGGDVLSAERPPGKASAQSLHASACNCLISPPLGWLGAS